VDRCAYRWVDCPGSLYDTIRYARLAALSPRERLDRLTTTLVRAKVRMPFMKAGWLARNVEIVGQLGGARQATREMLALRTFEEKMNFVRNFVGIGPKYARNIWMWICTIRPFAVASRGTAA
jgi:hypothetical protein